MLRGASGTPSALLRRTGNRQGVDDCLLRVVGRHRGKGIGATGPYRRLVSTLQGVPFARSPCPLPEKSDPPLAVQRIEDHAECHGKEDSQEQRQEKKAHMPAPLAVRHGRKEQFFHTGSSAAPTLIPAARPIKPFVVGSIPDAALHCGGGLLQSLRDHRPKPLSSHGTSDYSDYAARGLHC